MMKVPPYYKQEKQSTCSLAVLRMVFGYFDVFVTETELVEVVKSDYGVKFSNIWNPTIAKLACKYGIDTTLYADWPLLKKEVLKSAISEYHNDPGNFDPSKYENKNDNDSLPEPLPLAYKEMFEAINEGCKPKYGGLTEDRLRGLIAKKYLIQTSIRLQLMYSGHKKGFHSILIYQVKDSKVFFHNPFNGGGLSCPIDQLLRSAMMGERLWRIKSFVD